MLNRYLITLPDGARVAAEAHTLTEAVRGAAAVADVPEALIDTRKAFVAGFIGEALSGEDAVEYRHKHVAGFFPTWVPVYADWADEEASK